MYKKKYIRVKSKYQSNNANQQLNEQLYQIISKTENVLTILRKYQKGFVDMTGLNNVFLNYVNDVIEFNQGKTNKKPGLNFLEPKQFFEYDLLETHPYYFPKWKKEQKKNQMEIMYKNKDFYQYGENIIEGIVTALRFYQRYM